MMKEEYTGENSLAVNTNPLAADEKRRQRGQSYDVEQTGVARLSKSNLRELEGSADNKIPQLRLRDLSVESKSTVATLRSRTVSIIDEAKSGTRIMELDDHLPVIRLPPDPLAVGMGAGQPQLAVPSKEAVIEALEEVYDFNLEVVPMKRVQSGGSLDVADLSGLPGGLNITPKPAVDIPYKAVARIACFWIVYGIFIMVIKEETERCSPAFWVVLTISYVPVGVAIFWGMYLVAKYQYKHPSRVLLGDVDFSHFTLSSPRTYLVPAVVFVTGIICSLLGIGGGELIGPLFLVLQLLPQVAAASTSLMSCANATLNIIHYFFLGTLRYDWFLVCFLIGLLGGVSGRRLSSFITKTYGRPSFMVFALSLTLFMSVCLLSYRLSEEPEEHYYVMDSVCSP